MSVPVVAWPYGLPLKLMPLASQGGLQDNRIGFEPDVGPAIERPRTSWAPEIYAVEMALLTVDQFTEWQRFYRQDLAFGTRPFEFRHPLTRVFSPWRIRRGSPPYQAEQVRRAAPGAKCIRVAFSVESWPASVRGGYLLQENGDPVLQENGDHILVHDGYTFDPLA